ncbi:hypothetical protein FGSG_12165, partial [Fusarium graminearum PH-1]|uniref:hypothetical protein n=1 Tax=Gibberella zeae (strain ATCC MYA-4620 / CBS 123657 / FGSC 9075 / NRRL 31084 / PH-1) TaxID=229533 RepID=UPI00021F1832
SDGRRTILCGYLETSFLLAVIFTRNPRPGPDEKTRVWNDPSSQHDTILDSTELDGCNWTSDVDCANRREPVVGSAIVTSLQLAALGYYHAATGASPAGLDARKMGP